jgi:hypothetical protein
MKMRTTNKAFKEQIQNHITEAFGDDLTINEVVNFFHTEKFSHENEIRHYGGNKHAAFKDWMQGLPSSFNVEFTNDGIHNTLKSWYENAGQQYDEKKLQTEESEWYYHLVTREFSSLANKNGIKF